MSISTRVLRKFTGDSDLIPNLAEDGSDIDDSPFSSGVNKKQVSANRYDLLNQHTDSGSECKSEYEDDNNENDEKSGLDNVNDRRSGEIAKKKKKKKKKKSLKPVQKQSSHDDEVERSVKEVNAILGETVFSLPKGKQESYENKPVFQIDPRHLQPKNELKRIFGFGIIDDSASKKRHYGRRKLKFFSVAEAKENWPPLNKFNVGITMSLLFEQDGAQIFGFKHSQSYLETARECMNAADTMNPANLMMVVNKAPYHVDTLIQVSEIFKANDDIPMAADLVERALFSLESAFHPSFCLSKSSCKLPYVRRENRCLFIVLFKHMLFIGQKACYRTALEFSKVIFNLDPKDDPLAIVLILDFYALRAREFKWLIDFVEELDEQKKNLSQLPNIAFSKAVALFEISDPRADEALQHALMMFPNVLFPLLKACGVEPDAKTRSHAYFNLPYTRRMRALYLLVDLYVQRNFHFWRDRNLIQWLEDNAGKVLTKVDEKDPEVAKCFEKRSKRFEACLPRNVYRHVVLSDFKSKYSFGDEFQDNWYAFDPFPPRMATNLPLDLGDENYYDADPSLFTLYFRSILPSFEMHEATDEEDGAGGRNGEDDEPEMNANVPEHREFSERMRGLMGAMRHLLSHLPVRENRENPGENEDNFDIGDID